jgi:hypothetical protein
VRDPLSVVAVVFVIVFGKLLAALAIVLVRRALAEERGQYAY